MVEFFQDTDDLFTAIVAMVDSACQIKAHETQAEDDGAQKILHRSFDDDPMDNQGDGTNQKHACTSQMGQCIYGFSQLNSLHGFSFSM